MGADTSAAVGRAGRTGRRAPPPRRADGRRARRPAGACATSRPRPTLPCCAPREPLLPAAAPPERPGRAGPCRRLPSRHGTPLRSVLGFLWIGYPRAGLGAAAADRGGRPAGHRRRRRRVRLGAGRPGQRRRASCRPACATPATLEHEAIPARLMAPEAALHLHQQHPGQLLRLRRRPDGRPADALRHLLQLDAAGRAVGGHNHDGFNSEYWSLILPHGVHRAVRVRDRGRRRAGAGRRHRAGPAGAARRRARSAGGATGGRWWLLGTMPLLVIAGLIEGFITPSGLSIPVKARRRPACPALLLAAYLIRGRPRAQATRPPSRYQKGTKSGRRTPLRVHCRRDDDRHSTGDPGCRTCHGSRGQSAGASRRSSGNRS